MSPSDIAATRSTVVGLWPRTNSGRFAWTSMEWSLFVERCMRIGIDSEQADAALRNLKASSDKYPSTKMLLDALHRAEPSRGTIGPCSPLPPVRDLPDHPLNEHGRTSFEQRIVDDPKFAEMMHRCGRLSPERCVKLLGRAWDAKPPTKAESKQAQIDTRIALHEVLNAQESPA